MDLNWCIYSSKTQDDISGYIYLYDHALQEKRAITLKHRDKINTHTEYSHRKPWEGFKKAYFYNA